MGWVIISRYTGYSLVGASEWISFGGYYELYCPVTVNINNILAGILPRATEVHVV